MKQELLDLLQLNTYRDYSANKATDEEINELVSKCSLKLDENYLDFLKQINGFGLYNLNICGTRLLQEPSLSDVWHFNEIYLHDHPDLKDYFLIGQGFEEWYGYYPPAKKYYILYLYDDQPVDKGQEFATLDSLLDWAVKGNAKRFDDKKPIIDKKALLYIPESITTFLESRGFKKTAGDVLSGRHDYVREISRAKECVLFLIGVNQDRNRLFVSMGGLKRYDLIEDFLDPEDHLKTNGFPPANNYSLNLAGDCSADWKEFTEKEVNDNFEALTSLFISFIETRIFRALSLYDDVRVLDAKVNESLTSIGNIGFNFYWYYKMIIARLAGNPVYDELFKSIKERFENAIQRKPDEKKYRDILEVTLKLNDKLQKVAPLKDGRLA
ncbi:MAG: hypothetical protein WDO15_28710 [Bacteroidota bacterium]